MAVAPAVVGDVGSVASLRSVAHSRWDGASNASDTLSSSSTKRQSNGKMKVECDRSSIIYKPSSIEDEYGPFNQCKWYHIYTWDIPRGFKHSAYQDT